MISAHISHRTTLMPGTPDLQIGLRLALRARFFSVCVWFAIALATVALLAAQFSGRQPATVALDVGLSAIRLVLPLMVVLLVQELFAREFDRRYFLTSLTYPRPRHWLFLGRFLSAFLLTAALLVSMALLLAALVWYEGRVYDQATPVALGLPYLLTLGLVLLDLFVVLAVGSLLAIVASTPSFILIGTLGFTIVARSFSTIIILLTEQGELVSNPELYRESLGLLSYLLPDLGPLDVRAITLYGTMQFLPSDWPARVLSTLAYGLALIGVSLWVLQHKRFS